MRLLVSRFVELLTSPVRSIYESLISDPTYRSGFVAGLASALVVGWVLRKLLYWWNRVLQLFGPTKSPATEDGPSPVKTLWEALKALALLIILVAVISLVISLAGVGGG